MKIGRNLTVSRTWLLTVPKKIIYRLITVTKKKSKTIFVIKKESTAVLDKYRQSYFISTSGCSVFFHLFFLFSQNNSK